MAFDLIVFVNPSFWTKGNITLRLLDKTPRLRALPCRVGEICYLCGRDGQTCDLDNDETLTDGNERERSATLITEGDIADELTL